MNQPQQHLPTATATPLWQVRSDDLQTAMYLCANDYVISLVEEDGEAFSINPMPFAVRSTLPSDRDGLEDILYKSGARFGEFVFASGGTHIHTQVREPTDESSQGKINASNRGFRCSSN